MRILVCALVSAMLASPAAAGPPQCWYYLHNKLKGDSLDRCVAKADTALASRGFKTRIGNSSDNYITYVTAENDNTSVDVLCYEVNGSRGKVMAFITVAGRSACSVAKDIYNKMKNERD